MNISFKIVSSNICNDGKTSLQKNLLYSCLQGWLHWKPAGCNKRWWCKAYCCM